MAKKSQALALDPETFELAMTILDLSLGALSRLQWLMQRPGSTFTGAEKSKIKQDLAAARKHLDEVIAAMPDDEA